jgi:rubrerythrin
MDVELNTIIFYQKIKEFIRSKQAKEALDKIISEEERHLVKLKNIRLDLDPSYAGIKYGKFF